MDAFIAWLISLGVEQWAALVFIGATFAALSKRVRKGLVKAYKFVFPTRFYLKNHIDDEEKKLNSILAELRPNDNSSLRDAIDRIEKRQEDAEAFLSAQLNLHSVAVVRTDAKGSLIYVNRAYQRILSISANEVMGEGWVNVVHPEERARILKLWQETVKSGREFSEDIRFLTPTGKELKGHANVYKETNRRGEIRGYIGVISFVGVRCTYQESCFEKMIELEREGYEDYKKR